MNENECESTNEDGPKNGQTIDHAVAAATFTWGSAQYDIAAEQYRYLCKQEAQNGRNAVLVKYGITTGLIAPFEGEVLKSFKDSHLESLAEWEADGEDVADLRVDLEDVKNVTEALHFLRDWSWDLWSAVPYITRFVFPELNLDSVPDAPGFGPKFNVLAQNDNYRIGTLCWLLKSYGFVEDDEPFKEWDT